MVFVAQASWAADPPKRVFILDSYGRNVAPVSAILSILRTEITKRSPRALDLHEVSLEMARFAQPEQEAPFVNFLRERFAGRRPDLVVTVGTPAFEFLARHRDYLFPETPALFSALAEQVMNSEPLPGNAAAIPIQIDPRGMVENILQVLPKTENIAVIFGSSPNEKFWAEEVRREFETFFSRIRFVYLNQLSFDDIKSRVAALPPNSAIFYGLLMVDAAGTPLDTDQAIKEIVADANAPVFSLFESYFGLGTVGGRLIPERATGLQAAETALQILGGHPAADLSRPPMPPSAPAYDWRALQRWGIPESRLPPGSRIFFRQPSLWKLYHWHIAGAAGLLVLQAFLIARLMVQRRRRDRAEKSLLESEQRLRLITNSLPVLIADVDADLRYRFNNDAYKTWFGVSPKEAFGRTVRDVVGERNYRIVLPYLERALLGENVRFAQDIELAEGRPVSVEGIYVPDRDEKGVVRGIYVLALDVTERNNALQEARRLQDELLHAGRVSTMGELAGALAHEINQPLSAIMSNAQAARRYLIAPEPDVQEVREILDDIVAQDARAGDIIHRMRAFLKKTKPDFARLDLNVIWREAVNLLRSDAAMRDIQVDVELDPALPPVLCDRIQLHQVALNLLLNGLDAVADCPRGQRRVRVRTWRQDAMALSAVTDSGKGVADGAAEKIFEPFHSTKPQGLGMGLSVSRRIVTRHQGRIWFENEPGSGASFYVSLPLQQP
jgi:PAS domain S-box-containing protein